VQGIDLLGDNGGNASPVRRSPSLTSFMPTSEACAETTTCPSIDSLSVRLDHFLNTRRGVVMSPMPMSTSSQLAAPIHSVSSASRCCWEARRPTLIDI
jgi:hypothetical protein